MKAGYFRRIRFPLIVILGLLGLCGSLFYFAPAPLQPGSEYEIADTADTNVQKSATDSPLSNPDIDKNGVWQWIDLGIDLGHRPARLIAGSENRWYIEIDHADGIYRVAANRLLLESKTAQTNLAGNSDTVRSIHGQVLLWQWDEPSLTRYRDNVSFLKTYTSIVNWSPDYVRKTTALPNDPHYQNTLGRLADAINLEYIWQRRTDASHAIIALLDSGVNYHADELRENIWINQGETLNGIDDTGNGYIDDIHGWDFVDDNAEPFEEYGHGTKLAALMGNHGNNGIGGTGIAWRCRIMPIRVLGTDGYGFDSDIVDGLYYGVQNGARIFNLSLGGRGFNMFFENAMKYVAENNGNIIISAGNENRDIDTDPQYPAAYSSPGKMVIGGWSSPNIRHHNSNYGKFTLDFMAPFRADIVWDNKAEPVMGTSVSAAIASAFAALTAAEHPHMSPTQLKEHLLLSSPNEVHFANYAKNGKRFEPVSAIRNATPSAPEIHGGLDNVYILSTGVHSQATVTPIITGFGNDFTYEWIQAETGTFVSDGNRLYIPSNFSTQEFILRLTSPYGTTEKTFNISVYDNSWFYHSKPYPFGPEVPTFTHSYGNGVYVAIPETNPPDSIDYVLKSTDRMEWNRRKMNTDPAVGQWANARTLGYHINYHWVQINSGFGTSKLFYSSDGEHWHPFQEDLEFKGFKILNSTSNTLSIQESTVHYIFNGDDLSLVHQSQTSGFIPMDADEIHFWKIAHVSENQSVLKFSSDGIHWESIEQEFGTKIVPFYNRYQKQIWLPSPSQGKITVLDVSGTEVVIRDELPLVGVQITFMDGIAIVGDSLNQVWNLQEQDWVNVPMTIRGARLSISQISNNRPPRVVAIRGDQLIVQTNSHFYRWRPLANELEQLSEIINRRNMKNFYALGQIFNKSNRGIEQSYDSKNFRNVAPGVNLHEPMIGSNYMISNRSDSYFHWTFDGILWQRILMPNASAEYFPLANGIMLKGNTGFQFQTASGDWQPVEGLIGFSEIFRYNSIGGLIAQFSDNLFIPSNADGSEWEEVIHPYHNSGIDIKVETGSGKIFIFPNSSTTLPINAYSSINGIDWQHDVWRGKQSQAPRYRGIYFIGNEMSTDGENWLSTPNHFQSIQFPWIFTDTGRIYMGEEHLLPGWEWNNLWGPVWPTRSHWYYTYDYGWLLPERKIHTWSVVFSPQHGWLALHPSVESKAYSMAENRWLEPLGFHRE